MAGRQVTRHRPIRAAAALMAGLSLLLLWAPIAHAAPPTNDDRAGATPIGLLEYPTFDLTEATLAVDDPVTCPAGAAPQGSVWFAFTPTETGPVVVALIKTGSAAIHVLAPDGVTEIGCAATADATHLEAHVDLDAVAGEIYLIAVIGETSPGAAGNVFIEPPLVVSLANVTTAHVNADGSVVAQYVFTCSQAMGIEPELDLDQGSGTTRAMGSSLTTESCVAPTTTFEILVEPGAGPNPQARFRNGPADAYIQFNAYTVAQRYRSPAETKVIQLTGGPAVTAPPTDTSPMPAPLVPSGDPWTAPILAITTVAIAITMDRGRRRNRATRRSPP